MGKFKKKVKSFSVVESENFRVENSLKRAQYWFLLTQFQWPELETMSEQRAVNVEGDISI